MYAEHVGLFAMCAVVNSVPKNDYYYKLQFFCDDFLELVS